MTIWVHLWVHLFSIIIIMLTSSATRVAMERLTIVTGANTGIGFECAKQLAGDLHKNKVILACRNMRKAENAANEIRVAWPNASVECQRLDLADLSSIQQFVKDGIKDRAVNCLVLSAGVKMGSEREVTADGFEMTFQCNHLAPFYLTSLLMPNLLAGREELDKKGKSRARVVVVSSGLHRWGNVDWEDLNYERHYRGWGAYSDTKLMNAMMVEALQRKHGDVIKAVAVRPGTVRTGITRNSPFANVLFGVLDIFGIMKSPEQAGGALAYCATSADAVDAGYYNLCALSHASAAALAISNQDRLWDVSCKLLRSKGVEVWEDEQIVAADGGNEQGKEAGS